MAVGGLFKGIAAEWPSYLQKIVVTKNDLVYSLVTVDLPRELTAITADSEFIRAVNPRSTSSSVCPDSSVTINAFYLSDSCGDFLSKWAILYMKAFPTLFFLMIISCPFGSVAIAQSQDPFRIRVEVNAVVLPVTVIDKSDVRGGYEYDKEITTLTAKKFHVFEDGVEQKLQNVSFGQLNLADGVVDNIGYHREISTNSSGIWIWPESVPPTSADDVPLRVYTLTYAPPESSKGSCHQIKVKVDHRNATLDYRHVDSAGSDPMNGTNHEGRRSKPIALLLPEK